MAGFANQYHDMAMQMMGYLNNTSTYNSYGDVMAKWCGDDLNNTGTVKRIHVYDFDNTLFKTPHPNPDLLTTGAIGVLESLNGLHQGGWWADARFLQATGKGYVNERATAWDGWWNEDVVELVRLSMVEEDTLTILLSGRKSSSFQTLISQMVEAKGLKFDSIILRPEQHLNNPTLKYKNKVLTDLLTHFPQAKELTIYEDSPKQSAGFKKLFKRICETRDLICQVVDVYEPKRYLDPLTERKLIETVIASHNDAYFTKQLAKSCRNGRVDLVVDQQYEGFLLSMPDRRKALQLLDHMPAKPSTSNTYKFHANYLYGPASSSSPKFWINRVGQLDGLWAARAINADNEQATVILAARRKINLTLVETIDTWQELSDPLEVDTVYGTHSLLKLSVRKR